MAAIGLFLTCSVCTGKEKSEKEPDDRTYWCNLMYRMAAPVLSNIVKVSCNKICRWK